MLEKHMTSMSYKPEPTIWWRDTGQWIPCFDRCQLTVTWMSNIKDVRCKPRLGTCISWSMAAILCNIFVVVVIERMRPWSKLLPSWPWKKSCMSFYFYACMWFCSYTHGAPLGRPLGRRSSPIIKLLSFSQQTYMYLYVNIVT